MAEKALRARMIQKHEYEADWNNAVNFIPLESEIIIYDAEADQNGNLLEGAKLPDGRTTPYTYARIKIGDGNTKVKDLPFIDENKPGEITNDGGEIFNLYEDTTTSLGTIAGIEIGSQTLPKNVAGEYAHAEGVSTAAIGKGSHTEGVGTKADAEAAHAEGAGTLVLGAGSHAEGRGINFSVNVTAIDGNVVTVKSNNSSISLRASELEAIKKNAVIWYETDSTNHNGVFYYATAAETETFLGVATACKIALDKAPGFSIGTNLTVIMGGALSYISHVEGNYNNTVDIEATNLYGNDDASHQRQHAEGSRTLALGYAAHSEGELTLAKGDMSHAEGKDTIAAGSGSHAEGEGTEAIGYLSHAEGGWTEARGIGSHTEGFNTETTEDAKYAHAEGRETTASGIYAHAEGEETVAASEAAHAEGIQTEASGIASHAEGRTSQATGEYSHAEGDGTTASGEGSHAEGISTNASSYVAHAEGFSTTASGSASHAQGKSTVASGKYSHAGGLATIASNEGSTAIGKYNFPATIRKLTFTVDEKTTKDHLTIIIGNYSENSDATAKLAFFNPRLTCNGKDIINPMTSDYFNTTLNGSWTKKGTVTTDTRNDGYIVFDNVAKNSWARTEYTQTGVTLEPGTYTLSVMYYVLNGDAQSLLDQDMLVMKVNFAGSSISSNGTYEEVESLFTIGNAGNDSKRSNAFEVYADGHTEIQAVGDTDNSVVTKGYVDSAIEFITNIGKFTGRMSLVNGKNDGIYNYPLTRIDNDDETDDYDVYLFGENPNDRIIIECHNDTPDWEIGKTYEIVISNNQVQSVELLFKTVVDQTYNPKSEYAQSGKAVAEAIENEHYKLISDYGYSCEEARGSDSFLNGVSDVKLINLSKSSPWIYCQFSEVQGNGFVVLSKIIDDIPTPDLVVGNKYKIKLTKTTGYALPHCEYIKRYIVDQTYNSNSEYAQSGKAVAEAIANIDDTIIQLQQQIADLQTQIEQLNIWKAF